MNIQLTRGFKVCLACLYLISSRRQQKECESATVVRCDGLRFITVFIYEVKNDTRESRSGGVQSYACQCAGGGRVAKSPAGKREAQGDKFERAPTARQ